MREDATKGITVISVIAEINLVVQHSDMKIVIAGGSGQVGTVLGRALVARGHEVTIFTRRPDSRLSVRSVVWDGKTLGAWTDALEGADVLINLCGRSVNCRYTPANRQEIVESRVTPTRLLGKALGQLRRPPPVWLQASTATIYAHRYDQANDEFAGVMGGTEPGVPETWRFSIAVATQWERAAEESKSAGIRLVQMRSAMTMSPDAGGVFATLLRLVRWGLGGPAGDGRQFVSWIHQDDFVEAVLWIIAHPSLEGAVNLSAPEPLPNAAFMAGLREAWGTRFGLPSPPWLLDMGAALIRTETELILKSRRVVPGRLLESGFRFRYPDWSSAVDELCQRWRAV